MSSRERSDQEAAPPRLHRVLGRRDLGGAFLLRFSREGLRFAAGQWLELSLGAPGPRREYSIHSAPQDPYLEVLVREIPEGALSPALRRLEPGEEIEVSGARGDFTLPPALPERGSYLFCATGTGIAPFHSFVRSRPDLDYLLLHGARGPDELYDREAFRSDRHLPCLSREPAGEGAFAGRLTDWLRLHRVDPSTRCYLCGNSDMIYEARAILLDQGVEAGRIAAEVYF